VTKYLRKIDLKGERFFFGLQFQRLQSVVGPVTLGPEVRHNVMWRKYMAEDAACLMETRRERERERERASKGLGTRTGYTFKVMRSMT
jgi:hypothetical protein